jgi:hypothetical protein
MPYKIETTPIFLSEAKKLSKKFPSLKTDLSVLSSQLLENPFSGTSLGNSVFKIRMAIVSKGKGKSGGARVITFVKVISETVYLVSIYDKSEQESITDKELKLRIKHLTR